MKVGRRIKQYLDEHGIKQSFLADKTGLSNSRISDICTKDCKIDIVEYYKICNALNVSMDAFVEE